jgi:hypothetical protein
MGMNTFDHYHKRRLCVVEGEGQSLEEAALEEPLTAWDDNFLQTCGMLTCVPYKATERTDFADVYGIGIF